MKSLYQKILALGIWVIILPHLGFTTNIRKILFALTGLVIVYYAYRLKKYSTLFAKEELPEHVRSFSEYDPSKKQDNSITPQDESVSL